MSTQPEVAVGRPHERVDGRLKVTGRATYAADHAIDDVVFAVLVDSSIGRGRISSIDTAAAEEEPGVLGVLGHHNAPTLPYEDNADGSYNPPGRRLRVFQDDQVHFFGQPVAVVLAESLEAAQHAAHLVEVTYHVERPSTDLSTAIGAEPVTYVRGDAEAALDPAPVRLDLTYGLARNHHNPMEPHATIARWDRGRLTVWDKTQWVGDGTQRELATVFGLSTDDVHIVSPCIGGAFGSALRCWPHVAVAALAARETGRAVKLVMARRQLYFGVGYRPAYEYRLRLGAHRDGRLIGALHDIRAETSSYETFTEEVMVPGQMLYRTPAVHQVYRTVPLDVNTPTYMRGPGYVSAVHVLETALDELAHEIGIDPIELRARNEPVADPATGLPFSTRRLQECFTIGARVFGWADRDPEPGSTRDGDQLVGTGVAAAVYNTARTGARAAVRVRADGTAVIQTATTDMGPGTATALTQVAADELGLDMHDVTVHLGDSDLPQAPPHGASTTMASVGSAVHDGAHRVRRSAAELAVGDPCSPLHGADPTDVVATGGRLHLARDPRRNDSYQALLTRNGRAWLEATGLYTPPAEETRSMHAYGAIFVEVGVDHRLGLIRIRRMLGVYDAGRIINPRLAESQAIGGMVGGIGTALLEHTVTDHRDGRIVNPNLADYLVPVNADVPNLTAIFLDGRDDHADPIGVKGIGEVVQIGIAPAIANAVFHATGRRVRTLPITIEAMI
ncbi:xanthine dehydrogenase family protein molybdopterin-binding subunit [Pseudonocardia sp. TRM90224]|uniref:xanthine dehydrogenase family protein molybdopterin-binding subunit n=1 Tax=Pseudonocardia sp. TRM90224 TaxID=2812678 RepID=UPI001E3196F7|nr:xanthine dehydrogenase family protein molybdopterin-binding subunit [Pseudonocardia sp. TRM90224]